MAALNLMGGAHDLLYSKANWVIGDLPNGNLWIGSDGTRTATAADAPWFDARPYRQVQVFVFVTGLGGGTTPGIEVNFEHGFNTETALGFLGATTGSLAAAGGTLVIIAGGVTGFIDDGGTFSQAAKAVSFLPPFFRVRLFISGSATSLTAPGMRLYVYGVR